MAQFFYDNQVRRFLVQFARIFSNWYVTKGKDPAGNDILVRVPIMYGDSSRQASTILANNSASSLPSAPLITYYISALEFDQKRTQDPYYVENVSVRRRTFNEETQQFEMTQGDAFTVERIMPVPYTLRINVDFWTTNYNQKLELIEQLGVLFNPAMEIQSTDNFIDWTSLSVVYQDGLTFSSRTIPQGTGNPIDVMSCKFYMPIWISSAAKVKKLGVIHKIIASIFKGNAITDMQDDDLLLGTRQKITPYGYKLLLLGNSLQILPDGAAFTPNNESLELPAPPNTDIYWESFLNVYGVIKPGISQIWLQNPYMTTDIVGTIAYNPTDGRLMIYDIDPDTLPQNTLAAVDSVINPQLKGPEVGLPLASNGQRYLLVDDVGSANNTEPSSVWGNLIASANDIIEYDGISNEWFVSFDSALPTDIQFVTNLTSGVQYRFIDNMWTKSWEGWYAAGDFSIVI
ncbi:MAG: tail sheath stabilizer and completion protein [Candidatus Nanopelagicus sp.]